MKNFVLILGLLACMIACSKSDEVLSDNVPGLEWRGNSVTTIPAFEITSFTATSGGILGNNGGGNSTTEKGICYNTSPNPTTANNKVIAYTEGGTFECVLNGLTGNTIYYIRAYVIKNGVTTYGNQVSFTTYFNPGTVTDVDGNVYPTINIGGQVWMLENLKTTRYRDGTPIPEIVDNTTWLATNSGAYCNYNNDAANVATYGRLYNWFALNDSHVLAPAGWHVPAQPELDTLVQYLGGISKAGKKLKEAGFEHWAIQSEGPTNTSGFTGLPGGQRSPGGSFSMMTTIGSFWSTSLYGWWPYYISLSAYSDAIGSPIFFNSPEYQKHLGLSVRCIRD